LNVGLTELLAQGVDFPPALYCKIVEIVKIVGVHEKRQHAEKQREKTRTTAAVASVVRVLASVVRVLKQVQRMGLRAA
jgi:hypothetical protein